MIGGRELDPATAETARALPRGRGAWTPRPPIRIGDDPQALRAGLRQLAILRTIATAGQAAAIATAALLGVALPLTPMAAIIVGLAAYNVAMLMRLRSARDATPIEVAMNLAIDLAAIAALLFLSGGAQNPFVWLLVLHAVMIALLLPPAGVAVGALAVMVVYAALAQYHWPLAMAGGQPLPAELAALGDALSFVCTVGVICWFVASTAAALNAHERKLNEATQRALRDDAVLRVGAVAAGAAHELATPLTTVAVAVGEILRRTEDPAIVHDARVAAAQVDICREMVATLVAAGGHAKATGSERVVCDALVHGIAERCRTMRVGATVTSGWRGPPPVDTIVADPALRQSLLALINNAVDVSPHDVSIVGQQVGDTLRISIADRGTGLPDAARERLGRAFFTTKPPGQGAGLGVVLALRAIEQLGGRLRWEGRSGGGLVAEVELPLAAMVRRASA